MPTKRQVKKRSPNRSSQQRRSRPSAAEQRLKDALLALTARPSGGDNHQPATAAELCRMAQVSRNSLYRYHGPILQALQRYQQEHSRAKPQGASRSDSLDSENALLRDQLAKLAALVDHYYGAYRETHALLERRERELADVRRRLASSPRLIASRQ